MLSYLLLDFISRKWHLRGDVNMYSTCRIWQLAPLLT